MKDQSSCLEKALKPGQEPDEGRAADDDQVARPLAVVEQRLVGEKRNTLKSGNRWYCGYRSRCDHEAARLDRNISSPDCVVARKLCRVLDDTHAETGETLDRVIGSYRRDNLLDVTVNCLPIDGRLHILDSK